MPRIDDGPVPRLAAGTTDGSPLPRFAAGRVCQRAGCGTQLSVYNAGDRCWLHTESEPLLPLRRHQVRAA
jgi:hypothetical protein